MKNKNIKSALSAFLIVAFLIPSIVSASTFGDVSEKHKHYVAVEYLKGADVIGGYEDGTFKPNNPINRAEVLKIILQGSSIESPELTVDSGFSDVAKDAWFAKYIMKAKEIGIVKGNPDGSFAPARSVNKAELLKMLLIANNVDVSSYASSDQVFLDLEKDAWYFPYLNFAQETGLVRFNGAAQLEPAKELTRGEVADIMYLLIALKKQNNSKFLLEQAELQVASAMNLLNVRQYDDAYNSADIAYDFSSQALSVDENEANTATIESAVKLAESIKQLIDSYRMIVQQSNCEGAIEKANLTKETATLAWEKNHDVQKVARLIKDQADSLIAQCEEYIAEETTAE